MKKNITFILFAFNEASRIKFPIECYLPYGDVLVVDNFSSDQTAELARKYGARVVQYDNSKNMVVECKEEADFIFQNIKTEWVFWGYVDEMLPKSCLELFLELTKENSPYKIILQKQKTMLYNYESEYMPANAVIRLFKLGSIEFLPAGQAIHRLGNIAKEVKVEELHFLPPIDDLSIHHFSVYTTEKLIGTHNRYSTFHARIMTNDCSSFNIISRPLLTFFVIYILQGAFKKGILGFIVAVQYSYYIFQVLCKAYEIKNGINVDSIECNFREKKALLLSETPEKRNISTYSAIKSFIFSAIYIKRNFKKN